MKTARSGLVAAVRFLAALAAAATLPAEAQNDALEQQVLARCARLQADSERLACYDAATRWIEASRGAPSTPAASGSEGTEPSATPSAPASAFGMEQLDQSNGPDEITTRIRGSFSGWRGKTRFQLENGQVWQQEEPGRGIYRAENPRVTIRRAAMGTYMMSVEGVRRALRVRRIE